MSTRKDELLGGSKEQCEGANVLVVTKRKHFLLELSGSITDAE